MSLGLFAYTPMHSQQAVEQDIPCFLHEPSMVLHPDLQPQLHTTSKNFWDAGWRSVMIGINFLALTVQPQSTDGISPPNHSWTWYYTLRRWYFTEADVGESVLGWTGSVVVATFAHIVWHLRALMPSWGLPLCKQNMVVSPAVIFLALLAPWLLKTTAWSSNRLSALLFDIGSSCQNQKFQR